MSEEKFPPQGSDNDFVWNLAKYGLLPLVIGTGFYLAYQKISSLEKENAKLSNESQAQTKQLTALQSTAEKRNAEQQKMIELEKSYKLLSEKSDALNQQNNSQQKELENLNTVNTKLSRQIKDQQETIQEQDQQILTSSSTIKTLEKSNKELSGQIEKQTKTHQTQTDSLKESLQASSEQLDSLKKQNTSLNSINSQNQNNLECLQQEIKKLQTINNELSTELENQKKSVTTKDETNLSLVDEIKILAASNEEQKLQEQQFSEGKNPPPLPMRKASNAKLMSQLGNFSLRGTNPPGHQAMQEPREKNELTLKLIEIHKKESAAPHEKDFANYLIFLLALHKHDKTIKQIMAEAKEFLATELKISENELSEKFVAIAPIINSAKDIEDITIEKHVPNHKYHSLSEDELKKYHTGFKNELNGLPKNPRACNIFGVLLGNYRGSPYGQCSQYPNGFKYTKENYTADLKDILLKSTPNLSVDVKLS